MSGSNVERSEEIIETDGWELTKEQRPPPKIHLQKILHQINNIPPVELILTSSAVICYPAVSGFLMPLNRGMVAVLHVHAIFARQGCGELLEKHCTAASSLAGSSWRLRRC